MQLHVYDYASENCIIKICTTHATRVYDVQFYNNYYNYGKARKEHVPLSPPLPNGHPLFIARHPRYMYVLCIHYTDIV